MPSINSVESFPPLSCPDAKLLILGSMPGQRSLDAKQYYAHPRNAFWPIMAKLFGFDLALSYPMRTAALADAGVAVWDVLQSCRRQGSLDSAIEADSRVVNDFASFFKQHQQLEMIAFNGAEAERSFKRYLPQQLSEQLDSCGMQLVRLPSSSPAHTLPLEEKQRRWQELLRR